MTAAEEQQRWTAYLVHVSGCAACRARRAHCPAAGRLHEAWTAAKRAVREAVRG